MMLLASVAFVSGCAPALGLQTGKPVAQVAKATFFPSDEEVLALLRSHVDEGRAKSIVVGLLEPDGRRRVISYGSAGEGARPLANGSVFEIGSINKTFTGAILADMVRKGEVAFDDPVAKYLPADVRVPSRGGKQITLLDLATHTSGLPRLPTGYTPPDLANPYAAFQEKHLYEFLSRYELERDIGGAEPAYSNLGYGLLGHALARAAKAKSFHALVEQRILRPLGMKNTAYGRPARLAPWMTKGHNAKGAVVPYWDLDVMAGAGGLNSTVGDMLTYLDANVGRARGPLELAMRDAQKIYRPASVKGSGLGLAWTPRERQGQTFLSHSGGTAGYLSYIAFNMPSGAGFVLLTNSGGFDKISDVARVLLTPKGAPQAAASPAGIAVPASALQGYVGAYRVNPGLELVITTEDGKLFGQATGQGRLQLLADKEDSFLAKEIGARVSFMREGGAVRALTLDHSGRSVTARKQ
jgi:CubicO group peptidase (beta-lactamase class C family)